MLRLDKLEIRGFKSFCDYTEIVFHEGVTAVVGPNGCGKCVTGDTLITLADGRDVPIRELVDEALDLGGSVETLDDGVLTRRNPKNISILSLNPETFRLEARPVAAFIKRTTTPTLLRIRTRSGRTVTATPYHPLFTLKDGRLQALRAEELTVGVRLALPRQLPTKGVEVPLKPFSILHEFHQEDKIFVPSSEALRRWTKNAKKTFGTFSALSLAADVPYLKVKSLLDGQAIQTTSLAKLAQVTSELPPIGNTFKAQRSGHISLPEKFSSDLARFCGLLIAEGKNTEANQLWFVNSDDAINQEFARLARKLFDVDVVAAHYKPNAVDNLIYSRALCVAFERLFHFPIGSNSSQKEIPPQLFRAEPEVQWAFLSGLFEGDAFICAKAPTFDKPAHAYIEYTTASQTLAHQVVALLLRLGVFAVLRRKEKYASNTEAKKRRAYYSVLVYGTEQLRFAAQNLSFIGEKEKHLEVLRGLSSKSNPNHDVIPGISPLIKEVVKVAGVKLKPNRSRYPKLAAYNEGRCEVTRPGLLEIIQAIRELGNTKENRVEDYLERLTVLATSDVYWDEVVAVESVAPTDEWVYDLCVADTHNFVANNFIVHNSNVMDSISWVLGEQSAKNLRGGKMEDVIFNGTRDRKPLGLCEVTLTLTAVIDIEPQRQDDESLSVESIELPDIDVEAIEAEVQAPFVKPAAETLPDGASEAGESAETTEAPAEGSPAPVRRVPRKFRIPTLTAGEKITIGRRLYRSGESDYLINGRTCRLRDIQDFFSGTGLSRAHYAIIEQGKIGQVLSSKPYDRRALIEEAAGISKFKAKRHATEIKLEATRQNLSRLNDLTSEIERQVNSLRRQAQRARRYAALRDELRLVQRFFFTKSADFLRNAQEVAGVALAASTEQLDQLTKQLAATTEETAAARQAARDAEDALAQARQTAAQAELEQDRAANLRVRLTEQRAQAETRRGELAAEADRHGERKRLLDAEIDRSRKENDRLAEELTGDETRLKEAETRYRDQQRALQEAETKQEQLRSQLFSHVTRAERLRTLQQQLNDTEARLTRQSHNLEAEGARAAERVQQAEADLRETQAIHVETDALVRELRGAIQAANTAVNQANETVKQAQQALTATQRDRTRLEERLSSLRNLDAHHAYYSSTVQTIFEKAGSVAGLRVLGTLADFLTVPKEAEALVERVLGDNVQAVVVPTVDDAVAGTAWLEQNKKAGRAVFLVAGLHGGSDGPAVQPAPGAPPTAFLDLLGLPAHLRPMVERALPQFAGAEVAASLGDALAKSAADPARLFVTPDGEQVLGCTLLVTRGGERPPTSVLGLKREIKELGEQLEVLEGKIVAAGETLDRANADLAAHRDARRQYDERLREAETKLATVNVELGQRRRDLERTNQLRNVVASEKKQLETEQAQLAERMRATATELTQVEATQKTLEADLLAVQQQVTAFKPSVDERSQELSELRAVVAGRLERRRAASSELRRLEAERQETERLAGQVEFDRAETAGRLDSIAKQLVECEAQLEALVKSGSDRVTAVSTAAEALEASRAKADSLEARLAELRDRERALRETRTAQEIEAARLASDFDHLGKTCRNELGVGLDEIESVAPDVEPAEGDKADKTETVAALSLDELADRLAELKGKIESLGPVNMLALEELDEAEKRHTYLIEQRADVMDAIAATEEALKEIRKRTRQRLLDAFTQINRNFSETFLELFGGGRGEMLLMDPDDILESGIDIVAQPPGKRLQSVLLLSGGEKAMAALAFVLAIFRYRPSPFCVLDEVDAPLDESNVRRFAEKITEMSAQTQFLVITHNKRTMEVADTIYGVTMEEPGVSKLLSVRFEETPQPAEA